MLIGLMPDNEMPPPVLPVARFIMVSAKRSFLPIGHHHQTFGIEALIT
jgi:hypothetical protein